MSEPTTAVPEPDPFRLPEDDLDDLASALAATMAEVREHGVVLERLGAEPESATGPQPAGEGEVPRTNQDGGLDSVFVLTLDGEAYTTELAALTCWVDYLLLPVYGREISTTRPWCQQWHEHPEAVARLHGLWLAWQQLTTTDAGLAGPSIWHRDHLDHTLLQLRSPDGPFAACTTSAARPTHRVLATPAPATAGGER